MTEFVHLHNHTDFSLLDGMCRVGALAARVKELGMPAVAITDHGHMAGVIDFYNACREAEVKPIIGTEVYVAPRSRFDRDPAIDRKAYHLVLLAANDAGYRNLLQLVSSASLEGFYYKPRVDRELLAKHSDGVIAMSACLGGEVPAKIMAGDRMAAREAVGWHRDVFQDRYYLELQNHGIKEQQDVNAVLIDIAGRLDIPLVAANDAHYLERKDAVAHDVMLCIQTGSNLRSENRFRFDTQEFYVKSAEEMAACVPEEACRNTLAVAERCNLELEFTTLLPYFAVPEGETVESHLEALCRSRISWRFPNGWDDEKEARLRYELEVIQTKGFAAYFLIVHDLVQFARGQGIIAQARGSAGGCMVTYLLGISSVDPIANNLMFERFLRVDGKKMPDIDVDFCDNRREEVLNYVVEKYGADHVAQIATFGTMGAKTSVRDVARVTGVNKMVADRISKMMPVTGSLAEHLEEIAPLREIASENQEVGALIRMAQGVEGMRRHVSTHAAGVVISRKPLHEIVPVMRNGGNPVPTTQWDFRVVESVGLLKMDFLGVAYLTVCKRAFDLIRETEGVELSLDTIPLDDQETFQTLCAGETIGVFQLESSGMRALVQDLRPRSFADAFPLVALYRPGPLQSGLVASYVRRRHGAEAVDYPHPMLEPVLKNSYGILLYQEQVMRIAQVMGGLDPIQAEDILKAMGKKIQAKMDHYQPIFVAGAMANGVTEETAQNIWEMMANFAKYAFNAAHAAAYGLLAYHTAYLKTNYPAQYMAALLTTMDNKDKTALYVAETRRLGIDVLPPDINLSGPDFTVVPSGDSYTIRFGLSAVKSTQSKAIDAVIADREKRGPFRSLFQLCAHVQKMDKTTIENLINVGALDGVHGRGRRRAMIAASACALERVRRVRRAQEKKEKSAQLSLGNLLDAEREEPMDEMIPAMAEYSRESLMAFEKELLGLYLTDHPMVDYQKFLRRAAAVDTVAVTTMKDGDKVRVGGLVAEVKPWKTKKGAAMAFVTIEDQASRADVVVFPRVLVECGEVLAVGEAIVIEGKVNVKESQVEGDEEEAAVSRQVSILADTIRRMPKINRKAAAAQAVGSIPVGDALVVRVTDAQGTPETLRAVAGAFHTFPGGRAARLQLGDRSVAMPPVEVCPALVARLSALLGDGAVCSV